MRHQPGRSLASIAFLAARSVLHQQAQKLAALLDDTHVGDAGFVAGGGVFQVRDDLPHSVEGGGDAALPDNGAGQGGRENGEAVDRVDIGERHGIVHDSHTSRNAALARCNRDFTVPAGIPKVVAISFAETFPGTQDQHDALGDRQARQGIIDVHKPFERGGAAVHEHSLRGNLQVMLAGEPDRRPDGDRPYPGHDRLRGTQRRQAPEDRQQGLLCRIVGRGRGDPRAQPADIRGQLVEKPVQRERVPC